MATIEQCIQALSGVLGDLTANPAAKGLDRSLSCRLTDLHQVVRGPAEPTGRSPICTPSRRTRRRPVPTSG